MTFEEAGIIYAQLRQQFEQSTINQQEFEKKVAELVVVGPDGVTWQLEPNTGTWIQAGTAPSAIPLKKKKEQKPPETLFQLIVLVVKSLFSNLPKTIILGLIMAAATWVIHTYLIAKVNDGLMYKEAAKALNAVVNWQRANFPGVEAFWGLLSYFVSNCLGRIFTTGIFNWVKGFLMLPAWIVQSFLKIRLRSLYFMVFGIFSALLISYFIKNFMVSWILAFGLLLTMTAQFQSMEAMVLRLTLSDIQRLFKLRLLPQEIQADGIYITLLGLSAGFAIAGLWRTRLTYTFVSFWVFLALFIALLFLVKRREAKQILFFLLVVTGGIFLYYLPVFAWCQGASLSRVGGSWTKWWGMRNADVARKMGLMPAASSFLGSLLGGAGAIASAVFPGIGSLLSGPTPTVPKTGVVPGVKVPSTTTTPSTQDRLDKIQKINEEARRLKEEADKAGSIWGLIKGTLSNSKKEVVDTAKSAGRLAVNVTKGAIDIAKKGVKTAYDGAKKVYNDPSIITNGLKSGLNQVKDAVKGAANSVKGALKDVYNNPSIITDTLKGMAKDGAKGIATIGSVTKNLVVGAGKLIYNTVTDPKKMWGIIKDGIKDSVGFNNFKNSLDPNRSLTSRIGQTLIGTGKLGLTLLTFGVGTAKAQAAKAAATTAVKVVATTGTKSVATQAIKTGATATIKTAVKTAGTTGVTAAKTGVSSAARNSTLQTIKSQVATATKGTFTPAKNLPKLSGLTQKEINTIQQGLKKFGLEAQVRPPTFEGMKWIGKGVAKPEAVKNKTLGMLDSLLGAKGQPGLIGHYKPDKNLARNLINNIKNNPGLPPERKQQMIKEVMNTFKQRSKEFVQNQSSLDKLIQQGKISIKNGVIFDAKSGKPFIPDVDFFNVTRTGGSPAGAAQKQALYNYLKSKGVRMGDHGAHLDWVPLTKKGQSMFNKIIKSHGEGGEAVINFGQKGINGQYYTP